jgi:hypothetical protein
MSDSSATPVTGVPCSGGLPRLRSLRWLTILSTKLPVDNRSIPVTPLFSDRYGLAKVSEYFSPDGAPHPPDRDEPLAWDSLGSTPGLSSFAST